MIWIAVHLLHLNGDCNGNNTETVVAGAHVHEHPLPTDADGWMRGGGRLCGDRVHLRSIKLSLATSINSIYSNFLLLILNIRFVHVVCTLVRCEKRMYTSKVIFATCFAHRTPFGAYNFICNIVFYEPIKALALFGGRSFWKFRKELLMSSYLFRCVHLYTRRIQGTRRAAGRWKAMTMQQRRSTLCGIWSILCWSKLPQPFC